MTNSTTPDHDFTKDDALSIAQKLLGLDAVVWEEDYNIDDHDTAYDYHSFHVGIKVHQKFLFFTSSYKKLLVKSTKSWEDAIWKLVIKLDKELAEERAAKETRRAVRGYIYKRIGEDQ